MTEFKTQTFPQENRHCLRFETDNRDYFLRVQTAARECIDHKPLTNFERIKAMTIEEMAYYLVERWNCPDCSEHERLSDNPLLKGQSCDMQCKKHCREWLESEVEK